MLEQHCENLSSDIPTLQVHFSLDVIATTNYFELLK